MKPYLLVDGSPEDQTRQERLRQQVDFDLLNFDQIDEFILPGQFLVVSGLHLPALRMDRVENILRKPADLLVIPPYPADDLVSLLPQFEIIYLDTEPFSTCQATDERFLSILQTQQLQIFFQKSIRSFPGKTLLSSAFGKAVLVSLQPRSNSGRLLVTSLLLASLTARSNNLHKQYFWQALSDWLAYYSLPQSPKPLTISEPAFSQEQLLAAIMAIEIGRNGTTLSPEMLLSTWKMTLARFGRPSSPVDGIIPELIGRGLLQAGLDGEWVIDPEMLAREIDQLHLSSYLRRLR